MWPWPFCRKWPAAQEEASSGHFKNNNRKWSAWVVVGWWWLLLISLRMSGFVLELDKPGLRLSTGLGLSLPPTHRHFLWERDLLTDKQGIFKWYKEKTQRLGICKLSKERPPGEVYIRANSRSETWPVTQGTVPSEDIWWQTWGTSSKVEGDAEHPLKETFSGFTCSI